MRIDLHCHTKATKKGDGNGRNVTPALFQKKISDADVRIVAITNHNAFDLQQYVELSEVVRDFCLVWPGVEIDVLEPDSTRWHLIVIVNPKEVDLFSRSVKRLFAGDDIDECTHSLNDIYRAFKKCDAIYVAHFHKSPAIPEKDFKKLNELVKERHRIFQETTNETSMGVYASFQYNILIGSDVKEWKKYEKSRFAELKLPVDSFEQFCLLSKRDDNVVKTLLNKKESKNLVAKPATKVRLPLQIYSDVNIIFGQKGTGKTQIVKSLCGELESKGMKCVSYIASEREDKYKELLSLNGVVADLSKIGISNCSEDFKAISSWNDYNPTLFENYVQWKKTYNTSNNKKRMKITNSTSIPFQESDSFLKHKDDCDFVDCAVQNYSKVKKEEYLNEQECVTLDELLNKLERGIIENRREDLIEREAIRLSNHCIDTIKDLADMNTNSVSKPSTTGFSAFVENRIRLIKAFESIVRTFDAKECCSSEDIGSLEEKGRISVNTRLRLLCEESSRKEFGIGIQALKNIKQLLFDIYDSILSGDFSESLRELVVQLNENGINDILPFVGRSRYITNQNGELYEPSNGEKNMLLLQRVLSNYNADAFFLDEPELGMGNSYIDSTILPILINLAKKRKYIVVATHDANIAVRTLPYMSIYRTHCNGVYKTYVGNPFSDRLVNILDENDTLEWTEESLKSLEGSKKAFYERKNIYESKSQNN